MSTTTPNLGLFKYDITNPADLAAAFNIKTALNNNWDIIDEAISNSGGARNLGEIVASTIPLTDAGLHLLDGSLINGSGIYSDFVNYIAGLDLTANYFCTEQEWQQSITDYGVCGKFVYDSTNNTVRLPKVTGIIEGTTDLTALGDLVEAGLPNITGNISVQWGFDYSAVGNAGNGALYNNYSTQSQNGINWNASTSNSADSNIRLDASRSSSIYGNSSTVQPQTIKVFYYIVVATSAKTSIQVDIDNIATNLNNKVDIGDLQEVQCVVETYINETSWYRVYSDGWCEQGGQVHVTSAWQRVNLLKNFANTAYHISGSATNEANATYTTNGTSAGCHADFMGLTTSTFQVNTADDATFNNSYCRWQACGYVEV